MKLTAELFTEERTKVGIYTYNDLDAETIANDLIIFEPDGWDYANVYGDGIKFRVNRGERDFNIEWIRGEFDAE